MNKKSIIFGLLFFSFVAQDALANDVAEVCLHVVREEAFPRKKAPRRLGWVDTTNHFNVSDIVCCSRLHHIHRCDSLKFLKEIHKRNWIQSQLNDMKKRVSKPTSFCCGIKNIFKSFRCCFPVKSGNLSRFKPSNCGGLKHSKSNLNDLLNKENIDLTGDQELCDQQFCDEEEFFESGENIDNATSEEDVDDSSDDEL